MEQLKKPTFPHEPSLELLESTLVRGIMQPHLFDPELCPAQTVVLGFGQKGTSYVKDMLYKIQKKQIQVIRVTIGKNNIDKLAETVADAIGKYFHNADRPKVLVLENFEQIVLASHQYERSADLCADLQNLKQDLQSKSSVNHGILCLSNVPPGTGSSNNPVVHKMWAQFDHVIGYGVPSREERSTLFQWYFVSFQKHCSQHPELDIYVQLAPQDLEYLLDCSTQATPDHIRQFCQSVFHGAIKQTLQSRAEVIVNRDFLETGYLRRVGTLDNVDDERDQEEHAYCIVQQDLVAIQDAFEIAAGRPPYMGKQPNYSLGREQVQERVKRELEEEDRQEQERQKRIRLQSGIVDEPEEEEDSEEELKPQYRTKPKKQLPGLTQPNFGAVDVFKKPEPLEIKL